jgi:uncharacterized protein YbjT (DUF2867 family)
MRVAVAGATGTTGGEVFRQLRRAGVPVRALTRSEEHAGRLRGEGAEVVVWDPSDAARALEGVRALYLATPASSGLAEFEGEIAASAARAGVEHVVKLSVIGAEEDAPLAFARLHARAEAAVRGTGVRLSAIRPNGFMQNTLAWAAQVPGGVVRAPVMDARWSIVDVRDVAAVAVAALRGEVEREAWTATGPEASSPREQVAILSEVLGQELRAEEITVEQSVVQLRSFGVPEWTAERLGELSEFYATGGAQSVSDDVIRVTGRSARDYRVFAADHAGVFAP